MNAHSTPIKGDIEALFNKTKGNLFFKKGAGFLGTLLCNISFQWESSIPTAAINESTLYWNPDFYLGLDKDTRVTVLAHELYHNAYLHGVRQGNRCPDFWNQAADHRINNDLKRHGYYMDGFPYLMDSKYYDEEWSTDMIYDDLIQQGGKPMHNPLGNGIIPITDQKKIDKAIAGVVSATTTARMTGSAPGDIPGEVTLMIDKFLNPKLPWNVILYNFFNALVSEEYSYARPNRRYEDPLLRGLTGRNGLEHLVFFTDISASITDDEVIMMNSEVKHIQEDLKPERLTLITFDTKIHDITEFERGDDFPYMEVHGRGGTSLADPWAYIEKHRPTACVVFTDLEVDIPENPGVPIIWVCTNNASAQVPYGQLVHLSDTGPVRFGAPTPENFIWSANGSGVSYG